MYPWPKFKDKAHKCSSTPHSTLYFGFVGTQGSNGSSFYCLAPIECSVGITSRISCTCSHSAQEGSTLRVQ